MTKTIYLNGPVNVVFEKNGRVIIQYDVPDENPEKVIEFDDIIQGLEHMNNEMYQSQTPLGNVPTDKKVAMIKKFRILTNSGLAIAKWSVENLNTVIQFMKKHRRMPAYSAEEIGTFTLH